MKYIRKLVIAILVIIFCFCNLNIEEQTVYADSISGEIEVIMTLSEYDMQQYLYAFQKKYPDVTIKYTYYENYEEELRKRIESGDYGDVILVPNFMTETDYSKYLVPLGTVQGLSAKYNYLEQSKKSNTVIYGIPSSAYLNGMIYNKEVFDKAGIAEVPKTIEEFMEAMRLIEAHTDAIPFYTNYQTTFTSQFWATFPYIEMTGDAGYRYGDFLNIVNPYSDGTTHYQVYRMLYDMVELGYTEEEPQQCDWDQSKKKLNNGEIGCVVIGSWALSQFKEAGINGENVGYMPFPNSIDGKQYVAVQTDYSYGISKNTENKAAAMAYIEFMLEESGFALDHENLSIVKTDPYPDTYDLNENVVLISNNPAVSHNYQLYTSLNKELDLYEATEFRRVIDAASGISDETFDEIVSDWNRRWEKNRPESTAVDLKSNNDGNATSLFDNSEVQFSDAEQKYLLERGTLKVGFLQNLAPLSYEAEGYFCGAAYEMCDVIAKHTNLQVLYYGYPNTEALVQALLAGEIDMAAGIEKATSYEGLIKYSKNYFDYYNVLIGNETLNADNLSGKAVAVPVGEKNAYWNTITNKNSYNSVGDCIEAVQDLKADYTITNHYSANYYVSERDCGNVSILPYASSGSLYLAFDADVDATLVAICNKCIYSIASGDMEIALIKYMNPPAEAVTLQRFIETNSVLCFAILFIFFMVVIIGIIVIMREKDKSNKKHALDVKKYELLASLADEYMFEYDCKLEQVSFDAKFEKTFGFSGSVQRKVGNYDNPALEQLMGELTKILDGEEEAVTFAIEKANGEKAWYRLITSQLADRAGKVVHVIGKLVNVQKEMKEMENFQNKAEKDVLTQIYNREGFYKRLPKEAKQIMFAMIDLDNFKNVNDTLGHAGGDCCLKLLASQLTETMGDNAVVGRYGGDEFMIALKDATVEECKTRLDNLVHNMDTEVNYLDNTVRISISVGAVYSEELIKLDDMFEKADEALYITKEKGKNGYHLEECNKQVYG